MCKRPIWHGKLPTTRTVCNTGKTNLCLYLRQQLTTCIYPATVFLSLSFFFFFFFFSFFLSTVLASWINLFLLQLPQPQRNGILSERLTTRSFQARSAFRETVRSMARNNWWVSWHPRCQAKTSNASTESTWLYRAFNTLTQKRPREIA